MLQKAETIQPGYSKGIMVKPGLFNKNDYVSVETVELKQSNCSCRENGADHPYKDPER